MKKTNKQKNLPVQKNDYIESEVVGLGNSGEGVVRVDGYPLFLPYALKGETIRAKVMRTNPSHGFARLEEVFTESEERRIPPCPYYGQCGGCTLQHMSYSAQLAFKTERVKDCFTRLAGLPEVTVLDTIGMEEPWGYRNKVQMPIGKRKGEVCVGFYKGRTHDIIDINECLIQPHRGDELVQTIREWIVDYDIPVPTSDKDIREGQVRHLLLRRTHNQEEWMVVLVTTSQDIPQLEELKARLLKKHPSMVSFIQNINSEETNRILGEKNITLWGADTIVDTIDSVRFRISPHSFFQVNPIQTKVIYDKVLEFAEFNGDERVFDLYCGAGTISLYIANHVKSVTGVEIVPEAIDDANFNKEQNNITNVDFILGKSEEVMKDLIEKKTAPDVLILDPPRKGCEPSLLETIGESNTSKIIYVSCDPATLARDAGILANYGYQVLKAQPIDNFPQTSHVECVVLMSRISGGN